ncbi:protein SMALL AUXIN UP-REGULATED RNA 51-like [Salvia miltiorrhiza]|uniref:protein SMALL AUXIN UP-REGULATED RNA 51-like n=1 Tax=Salvia miltiorrhiza TaxID=226208 RepID=UPI0025AC0F77|nr:protein SMALL AUXIN UP-REGULATED RNA 51-like [Salvia miltiorrhiza]
MSSGMKKVNMISKIVRLKQVVTRWKSKSVRGGGNNLFYSSSDSDYDEPAGPNRRTPSGSVAVYVGPERRRFVIPTRFLNLPVFVALLNQAEEEFGYPPTGGLTLPCETVFFTNILRLLEKDEERFRGLGIDEFLQASFDSYDRSSCKGPSPPGRAVTPLLQKTRV